MTVKKVLFIFVLFAMAAVSATSPAEAASNSNFTQVINAGVLSTDILDANRVAVTNPAVSMSAKAFSFNCYAAGTASVGTLGSDSERLYVSNPDGADNGWTLTLAATAGPSATWVSANSNKFDFNDPTGATAGCSDGTDADAQAGQLAVNPTVANLTTDCTSCSLTGVSLGASSAFSQGITDSITLLNAGASSSDVWRGFATNIMASQTIPAETPSDTYSLGLTLTATAQ